MQLNEIMGLDFTKVKKTSVDKKVDKAKKKKKSVTHDELKDKSAEMLNGMLSNIKN